MLARPTFRSTWLPLGLGALALLVLNLGLYTRLATQQVASAVMQQFSMPYYEDFSVVSSVPYEEYGGDWEIRDEMLVQLSTSGFDLMTFVPVAVAPDQPYAFETTLRYLGGSMGGGLMFNAQQTTSRQQSHMVRFNVDAGQLWLIYGYFGDDSDFVGQGSASLEIAPDDANPHQLRVQVGADGYALFVDGRPVASGVPLVYRGGAVGFVTAASQVAFDDIRIDSELAAVESVVPAPVEPAVETSDIPPEVAAPFVTEDVVLADAFDGSGGDSLWRPISGDWRTEAGQFMQVLPQGYDLSALHTQPVTYPLSLQVRFSHLQGAGGGLLFNLSTPDNKNGGHMVRYVDTGDVIAWGYFDAAGVFNGQGSASVAPAGAAPHTLTVRTDGDTYAVMVDGVMVVDGVPVVDAVTPGYIGLTASQSVVAFDEVVVAGDTAAASPQVSTANIDAALASGDWVVDNGVITQQATESTDYVAGTGLAGEQFTVSVDIKLPDDNPDAGAGIIFHMDGRDDRSMGHMVRFGSGGQELFWGHYDAAGIFTGEGGIPLNIIPGEPQNLLLVVYEDRFDIQVNRQTVVEAIPIERGSGWIGLLSFSGPVTFSNVSLQLGG